MGNLLLAVLTPAIVIMIGQQVRCSITCVQVCGKVRDIISCSQSLILVSDVTNQNLERNGFAFENTKRDCMGKDSCNLSRVCDTGSGETLLLHYTCVNASDISSKTCKSVEQVKTEFGHIQSPEYPASTSRYSVCQWKIEPPRDGNVLISLHDIVLGKNCFEVSGVSCDSRRYVNNKLCEGGNLTNLMLCNTVNIKLHPIYRSGPMRFWLSFHVGQKSHDSSQKNSNLHCSQEKINMDEGSTLQDNETTPPVNANSSDSNTEVLIIMLSIISGISAVLLVILIVVCIRCRLLQASRSEPLYSDPSPSVPAHIEYISSMEPEKPCPRLADGYFEVADALPFMQRVGTPTSPAYAEVENFAHPRSVLKASSSEVCLSRSKSLNENVKMTGSELSNKVDGHTDNYAVTSDIFRPKRGVLGRLKGERGRDRLSTESRNSSGPRIILISVKKDSSNSTLPAHFSGLQKQIYNEDDGNSTYEPIGKYSPSKFPSENDKKPPTATCQPWRGRQFMNNFSKESSKHAKCQKSLERNKDISMVYSEPNSCAQPLARCSDTLECEMSAVKKQTPFSRAVSSNLSEGSKTLPCRKPKAYVQPSVTTNNDYNRNSNCRDMPRASGIVKNGIRRFEQNSS